MSATKMIVKQVSEQDINIPNLNEWQKESAGVREYPILDFDEKSLCKLQIGVKETLKNSKVQISGGKGYEICKRLFDICAASRTHFTEPFITKQLISVFYRRETDKTISRKLPF